MNKRRFLKLIALLPFVPKSVSAIPKASLIAKDGIRDLIYREANYIGKWEWVKVEKGPLPITAWVKKCSE